MARDYEKEFTERPFRSAIKYGLLTLGVIGVMTVSSMVYSIATAPVRTVTGIVNRTLDSDNVLYNYEWFKRQYQDVQATDVRIKTTQMEIDSFNSTAGPRTGWTFEDKQESARLNSIMMGLAGDRASMVAEYNARSQMANRSLFKTGDLPESL